MAVSTRNVDGLRFLKRTPRFCFCYFIPCSVDGRSLIGANV
jgi:hypothetical protein